MTLYMRKLGSIVLLLLGIWHTAFAQPMAVGSADPAIAYHQQQADTRITGIVRATETDDLLEGVTIQVKGITRGTVTDAQGKYYLQVPDGATTLIFSYTGFERIEVEIGGRTTIDITLGEDDTVK